MTENNRSQHTDRRNWFDELAFLLLGGFIGALLERLLQPVPIPVVVALSILAIAFWLLNINGLWGRLRNKLLPYMRYILWSAFFTSGLVVGTIVVSIASPSLPSPIPPTSTPSPPCPSIPETLPELATITMSNLDDLQEIGQINVSGVLAVVLSGNGHWFAVATNRGMCMYEWESMSGSFGLFSSQVTAATFSLDGYLMALGDRDGTIAVWDVRLKDTQVRWKFSVHKAPITSLAFNGDGRWLASGSNDHTVHLSDSLSGKPDQALGEHSAPVKSLAFGYDNHLASGDNNGTVKVWDVVSRTMLISDSTHRDAITSLAFSSDGEWLASGSKDKTILLWNTDNNRIRQLVGHTGWVLSVSFSLDGRLLVSSSEDRTIRVWKVDTGVQLRTLNGHTAGVYGVAFSPDGTVLVSGSGDIVDNTNWADYVFDEGYQLAPLSEVETHIHSHHHLPGIPSAAQVAKEGVSMGDMQARLLSKVEELTLHLIAQEKRIDRLEQENRQLKAASTSP